jgi:hypothetical protein
MGCKTDCAMNIAMLDDLSKTPAPDSAGSSVVVRCACLAQPNVVAPLYKRRPPASPA